MSCLCSHIRFCWNTLLINLAYTSVLQRDLRALIIFTKIGTCCRSRICHSAKNHRWRFDSFWRKRYHSRQCGISQQVDTVLTIIIIIILSGFMWELGDIFILIHINGGLVPLLALTLEETVLLLQIWVEGHAARVTRVLLLLLLLVR